MPARIKCWLLRWFYHPARWWEFWLPRSGMFGGFIIGVAFSILLHWAVLA